MNIDDIVSPSDMKLIELASGLCDDLITCFQIFADRNDKRTTSSFVAATLQSLTASAVGKEITTDEYYNFLISLKDREG